MAEWLPGMLPADAGRLERAARRYAIAAYSSGDGTWKHADALCCDDGPLLLVALAIDKARADHVEPRLLRARVALYLRWCERVERGETWGWWDGWANAEGGVPVPWHTTDSVYRVYKGARWSEPLWTQAPAHDPSVTAADRRATKQQRKV